MEWTGQVYSIRTLHRNLMFISVRRDGTVSEDCTEVIVKKSNLREPDNMHTATYSMHRGDIVSLAYCTAADANEGGDAAMRAPLICTALRIVSSWPPGLRFDKEVAKATAAAAAEAAVHSGLDGAAAATAPAASASMFSATKSLAAAHRLPRITATPSVEPDTTRAHASALPTFAVPPPRFIPVASTERFPEFFHGIPLHYMCKNYISSRGCGRQLCNQIHGDFASFVIPSSPAKTPDNDAPGGTTTTAVTVTTPPHTPYKHPSDVDKNGNGDNNDTGKETADAPATGQHAAARPANDPGPVPTLAALTHAWRQWRARIRALGALRVEGDTIAHGDRASHAHRAQAFVDWLAANMMPQLQLLQQQQSGPGSAGAKQGPRVSIVDVAGGDGQVACLLALQHGVRATVVDSRPPPSTHSRKMRKNARKAAEQAAGRPAAAPLSFADGGNGDGTEAPGSSAAVDHDDDDADADDADACLRGGRWEPAAGAAASVVVNTNISPRPPLTDSCSEPESGIGQQGLTPEADAVDACAGDGLQIGVRLGAGVALPFYAQAVFGPDFITQHAAFLASQSAIVGFHPDEATEAIIDYALAAGKPFAVVPCCVFTRLYPHRRLRDGGEVASYESFLRYLSEKGGVGGSGPSASSGITGTLGAAPSACAGAVRVGYLPYVGRNAVVYSWGQPRGA